MKPRVLIPWTPGTNCHHETALACELAGARVLIRPLKAMQRGDLSDCDLLVIPGGFSWGDHFGSGRIMAVDLRARFGEDLHMLRQTKIPVLGICNGFQVLVNLGLLPGTPASRGFFQADAALDFNAKYRFEHWHSVGMVLHEPIGVGSVWTNGLAGRMIHLPVAHGEGRLVRQGIAAIGNVVATYGSSEGETSYPASPNGSYVAGICDDSGLVMGMMPHPERRVDKLHGGEDGLAIFQAGVEAVKG